MGGEQTNMTEGEPKLWRGYTTLTEPGRARKTRQGGWGHDKVGNEEPLVS